MIKVLQDKIYDISKLAGDKIGLDLPYFVKNGFWVSIRQAVSAISGILLYVAFARLTTKEIFGQYQLVLSMIGIISILSLPGINASIVQSVAKKQDGDYRQAIKTKLWWSLLGIPALLFIGGYYYLYESPVLGLAIMIASVFFPWLISLNIWDAFLTGKELFNKSALWSSIQAVINAFVIISVIFLFPNNLIAIIIVYLIGNSAFNILWIQKSKSLITNDIRGEETLGYGKFITKISIFNIIARHADKILIAMLISPAALAVYVIGTSFAKNIMNISKSFLSILTPKIARIGIPDRMIYFKVFFIAIIPTVILYFILPWLITFLFSDRYTESIFLSQIVIVFFPFFIINLLYKNHFVFHTKNKDIILANSIISPLVRLTVMIPLLIWFAEKGLAFLIGFQYILGMVVLLGVSRFFQHRSRLD